MQRQQNLYQVLKLSGKFIIDNNYNIANYTLQQAVKEHSLVSVGDNLLFDAIRRYRGDNRDYKEIFQHISQMRNALSKARKDGNVSVVRAIERKITQELFVPDVINVEYQSKGEHRKVAKAGFYVNGVRYIRFSAGAGQLRRQTVTFINAELYDPMYKQLMCGLDEKISEMNLAKLSAYFALATSSVLWVDTPRCCIIKDFDTVIPDQKVDWVCKDENGEGYVETRLMDIELNSADGQGLIDPTWAAHWAENMGLDYVPSSFVVRSCFVKGNLVPFDFKEYAHRNNISTIKDEYGIEHNIDDIDCLISSSQFKMHKYYKNFEEYLSYFNKYNLRWGVARYNQRHDEEYSLVNYQYLQVLSLTDDEIKELIKPTIDWLQKVCTGDELYALLYSLGGFDADQIVTYNDAYSRAQSTAMKAVIKNSNFLQDTYVQRKIYKNIVESINRGKIGKIWVRGNYQFCISDPIAQCRNALGLSPTGEIPADNVYCNFWNDRNVTGMIDICRSPMIDKHEHNPCALYRSEEADYWYQHIRSGCIFSIYDTSVCRMEDSDFDGDIVLSTNNPYFVKGCDKDGTNVIMYDKPSAPVQKINHINMIQTDIKAFGNKVGVYSNHATVFEAMRGLFNPDSPEIAEINLRKQLLREIIGAEIDSTKGLEKPKEPHRFTHTVNINDDDDEMTIAKKQFDNSLAIRQKPYFFRYLYPDLNRELKNFNGLYDATSKTLFGLPFKALKAKKDKTKEEKRLIARYYKFIPVIQTDCTMNNICKQFESLDFDIQYDKSNVSMLPYKDLSTFDVNVSILNDFREMYRDFSCKKSLDYYKDIMSSSCADSEALMTDDDATKDRFEIIDIEKDKIKERISQLSLSTLDILTYIKILSLQYSKFNWSFAWDLLDADIVDVIDEDKTFVPIECEGGEHEYLGKHYRLVEVIKETTAPEDETV